MDVQFIISKLRLAIRNLEGGDSNAAETAIQVALAKIIAFHSK
jgi:hypothetical protein